MSEAITDRVPERLSDGPRARLSRGVNLTGLAAVFRLTLRQHARGRRLIVLSLLFAIPAVIAGLVRYANPEVPPDLLEQVLVFALIPNALAPLAALLYASGMIQDEVEEQTLTYLLVRPLPRWGVYLTKLLATWLLTALLCAVFTTLTFVAVYAGKPELGEVLTGRAAQVAALMALTMAAYCALFGFLSLQVRWSLVAGVAYIVLFEGVLANIDFAVRRATVMYYFRVLSDRWLGRDTEDWALRLDTAPSAEYCVAVLAGVSLLAAALAAYSFTVREFRVKTPGGG